MRVRLREIRSKSPLFNVGNMLSPRAKANKKSWRNTTSTQNNPHAIPMTQLLFESRWFCTLIALDAVSGFVQFPLRSCGCLSIARWKASWRLQQPASQMNPRSQYLELARSCSTIECKSFLLGNSMGMLQTCRNAVATSICRPVRFPIWTASRANFTTSSSVG